MSEKPYPGWEVESLMLDRAGVWCRTLDRVHRGRVRPGPYKTVCGAWRSGGYVYHTQKFSGPEHVDCPACRARPEVGWPGEGEARG